MDDDASEYLRTHRVECELKGGRDPEIRAGPPHPPEEIGVLRGAGCP
jgi:hypothetical protein